MSGRETKHLKALYFDLYVKKLEEIFSKTNPTGGYRKIHDFLGKRGFSHEQYSGYHSGYKMTDLEIFDLVHEMDQVFPWFSQCLNHFKVTNIGANHDLMQLFDKTLPEPDIM